MSDAGREVAGVRVDARRCSRGSPSPSLEVDPGRDPPAADRQERQAQRPVRPVELEQAPEEDPALGAARRVREEAVGAPVLLVQVDERLEVGERVGRVVEADLADRLGPADLAPDLVALLLAERREVVVDRPPRPAGSTTGQTSSRSTLSVQPSAISRAPNGRGQGVGRRVAAAEAAEVDDVPRPARRRLGQVVGERVGDGRQVRRRGEDRRVVGVVRGAEEDGRGGRRDRRQLDVGAVAHLRVGDRVARLDLVAMHERHDRDRVARRPAHRPGRRRASPRGRSRRRRPTRRAGRPSRRTGSPTGCGRRARPTCSRGMSATVRALDAERSGRGPVVEARCCRPPDRQAPRQGWGRSRPNATPRPAIWLRWQRRSRSFSS